MYFGRVLIFLAVLGMSLPTEARQRIKVSPVKVTDLYGHTILYQDLLDGENPILLVFLDAESLLSHQQVEIVRASAELLQARYGLHTVLLSNGNSPETRDLAMRKKWNFPTFCISDSRLKAMYDVFEYPTMVLLNHRRQMIWRYSGLNGDRKPLWERCARQLREFDPQLYPAGRAFSRKVDFLTLYGIVGRTSDQAIRVLGPPRHVDRFSSLGRAEAVYYYGGDERKETLRNGLSVRIQDGKISTIQYRPGYTGVLFGAVRMGASLEAVEQVLGEPRMLVQDGSFGDREVAQPMYVYREWGITTEYAAQGHRPLMQLTISGPMLDFGAVRAALKSANKH